MSFNVEGKKCALCKAYLFSDDDVVFCPECGAPHHRSCYNHLGHCALEEFHGTENCYDASKEEKPNTPPEENPAQNPFEGNSRAVMIKCPQCGRQYPVSEGACPNCGAENGIKFGNRVIAFDLLGGVPESYDLGDGVTALEAKNFVVSNTPRFIPKFARMKEGQRASFNLLAFFFPCAWFLSRKMYKLGALAGAVTVALNVMMHPFLSVINDLVPDEVRVNTMEVSRYITDNFKMFNKPVFYVALVCSLLVILLNFLTGIFGDFLYRNHVLSSVKDIKENSEDREYDTRKRGGVSLLFMILGLIATQYLPMIIVSLAGL